MATMLNVIFDENGYVRSYATAGTLPDGIDVAIEDDIDKKDLFNTFSYYKLSDKFISVTVPKKENNEDNQTNSKDNNTEEILVKKLVFDKLKYYDEMSKTSKCDSCCLY
nr:MAG TPA: Protein of unknown function (DUF2977) [Caudoviricetes sp.]